MKKLVLLSALLAFLVAFSQRQDDEDVNLETWCKTSGQEWGLNEQGYNECTVGKDAVVYVFGALTISQQEFFQNYGSVGIYDIINNYGTITISDGGFGIFHSANFYNYGTIDNDAFIANGGLLNNKGTINNSNTFRNNGIIHNICFGEIIGNPVDNYDSGIISSEKCLQIFLPTLVND